MNRIYQASLTIEGPIDGGGIEKSVELLKERLKKGDIKGLYIIDIHTIYWIE